MKYAFVVLACVLAVAAAQNNRASAFASFGFPQQKYNQYQPNNQFQRYQSYKPTVSVVPTYEPVVPIVNVAPVAPSPVPVVARVVADARSANTLKYGNEATPEGSFNYYFDTENGIAAQVQGSPRSFAGNPPASAVVQQGSFSWTSPEGQPISITYVADENGYQPQGSAIPVPPAIPAQIQRALEYTAKYISQKK